MSKVMLLNTGLAVFSHNPPNVAFEGYTKPEEVWRDIVPPLSKIYRAAGRFEWTIAQHSLLVAHLCPKFRFAAISHDYDESLSSDIPTPFHGLLSEQAQAELKAAQRVARGAIYKALGVPEGNGVAYSGEVHPEVHIADQRAFALELAIFKNTSPLTSQGYPAPNLLGWVRPEDLNAFYRIQSMTPTQVELEHWMAYIETVSDRTPPKSYDTGVRVAFNSRPAPEMVEKELARIQAKGKAL